MLRRTGRETTLLDDPILGTVARTAAKPFVAVQEGVAGEIKTLLGRTKELKRLYDIWPDGMDVSGRILRIYGNIAGKFAGALKSTLTPEAVSDKRASSIHTLTAGVLACIGGLLATFQEMTKDIEQPPSLTGNAQLHSYSSDIPVPNGNLDAELLAIDSVENLYEFIRKYTQYKEPTVPVGLARTYHRSPPLNANGKYEVYCSTVAHRIAAKWARQRGIPSYEISLWPAAPERRTRDDWHQFLVIRMDKEDSNGKPLILVFDNNRKPVPLRETIEEHVQREYPSMVIMPLGGVVLSQERQDNILARFLPHLRQNIVPSREFYFPDAGGSELVLR